MIICSGFMAAFEEFTQKPWKQNSFHLKTSGYLKREQPGLVFISCCLHFSNTCAPSYSAGHIYTENRYFQSPCHSSIRPKTGGSPLWTPLWWPLNRGSHCSDDFSCWQVSTILSQGLQPYNSEGNKRNPTNKLWPPVSLSTQLVQQSVLDLEIWQAVI